jgi:tetratricopeptide (TPR) repeat protein/tRNA A-37 threonylcarbamoyl transferase component Bud32
VSGIGHTQGIDAVPEGDAPPEIAGIEVEAKVGEGGFGTVWLGWQLAPARRRVAIKLMRHALASELARHQFELEQAALASLQHASVATLHLAGIDRRGRPFVVLEWIDGEPITTWCDARRLGIRERVALLAEACDAVQHAHLRGIVHCDLKPANLLVTERDGRPVVKVIDFGLTRSRDGTIAAIGAPVLGTPGYMAPEQRVPGRPVDGRTDVWSMGVLLVELLTGRRCDEADGPSREPTARLSPSAVVGGLGAAAAANLAERRAADRETVIRELRDGPDWIAARALADDPEARYGSMDAMRGDLSRWLRDLPLEAGPQRAAYRLRLFVRRNRVATLLATAALIALVAGAVVSTLGWIEARAQFRASQLQLARTKELLRFTKDTVLGVTPEVARESDTTVLRLVLADSARRLESEDAMDPQVRFDLASMLGQAYFNIGAWPEAERFVRLAREQAERAYGSTSMQVASADAELAEIDRVLDRVERAVEGLRSAHDRLLALTGPSDPDRIRALASLGWALVDQGKLDEGRAALQEALDRRMAAIGPDDPSVLQVRSNLAEVDRLAGRVEQAIEQGKALVADRTRVLGADHPDTLVSANNLSVCLLALRTADGRTQAIEVLEPAVARSDKVLGADHPYTLRMKNNLASTLREHGEAVRAEALLRDLLARYERVFGPAHSSTLIVINNLALALEEQDRFDEALALHRSCLDRKAQASGEDAPTTAISRLNLGKLLLELGKADEGLPMVIRARGVLQAKYGIASKATIAAIDSEAKGLAMLGRAAEAVDLLRATMANADWAKVVPGVAWRIPGRLAKLLPADDATRAAVVEQARELATKAGAVDALDALLAPAPTP